MKSTAYLLLSCLIGTLSFLTACTFSMKGSENPVKNNVRFSGKLAKLGNKEMLIYTYAELIDFQKDTLAKLRTGSGGNFDIKFEVNGPSSVYVSIDDNWFELFVEPGADLVIEMDTAGKKRYSGKGAAENNYIAYIENMGFRELVKQALFEKEPLEFFRFADSLLLAHSSYQNEYMSKNTVSEAFKDICSNEAVFLSLIIKDAYCVNQSKTADKDKLLLDSLHDTAFKHFSPPQNQKIVTMEYLDAMKRYYAYSAKKNACPKQINPMELWSRAEKEGFFAEQYKLVDALPAGEIKELLLVWTLKNTLKNSDNPRFSEEQFAKFKQNNPSAAYLASVEKTFKARQKLQKGMPAPDFSLQTFDGMRYSLADFKGKKIFINFWATWCTWCEKEALSINQLLASQSKNGFIVLNINMNDRESSWRKRVKEGRKIGGLQLFADEAQSKQLLDEYDIQRIPQYVLIDEHGNIIKGNCERPSFGPEVIFAEPGLTAKKVQ